VETAIYTSSRTALSRGYRDEWLFKTIFDIDRRKYPVF